jgi:O-antigen/teichoic acid export membrane protein
LSSFLIASISKSKSSKDSKKLLYFNLTFFIILSIISIIFIFYYYSDIMNFIFKKDSFLGNNYFFWTSFNYILLSIHLYFSYYFFGKNKPKIPAISMTITLLVNFCLSSYLISSHGIFGLLFSNFISIIIGNVVIYFNFFCHED